MEKLLLIDGHSILNRAFYGLPDLTNAKGEHTNAVYGFLNIMFKLVADEKPDCLAVAFDVHAPTFRHKMYEQYKGTRKPMAEELRSQVPMIHEMLSAMNIPTVECEGLEADDILGTLSKKAASEGYEVVVVSGDRDLLQLADEHIKISIPKTGRTGTVVENYYAADVLEQKGVTPLEFIDVKALWGDTADNIPGVPGIGEKTATNIIKKYHSIENAHDHIDELKPPRASKNLAEYWDQAVLSKELATIVTDADVCLDMEAAKYDNPYTDEAYLLCKRWEFNNLLDRFSVDEPGSDISERFFTVSTSKELDEALTRLNRGETMGFGILENEGSILGMALSNGEDTCFVRVGDDISSEQIRLVLSSLIPGYTVCARDLKEQFKLLDAVYGEEANPFAEAFSGFWHDKFFDASVAAYLLNPLANTYSAEDIARDYMGLTIPSFTDLFGKDKPKKVMGSFLENAEKLALFMSYDAYVAAAAEKSLRSRLRDEGMEKLYDTVELPLVFVLFDMEKAGIGIDGDALSEYGKELSGGIDELRERIYDTAGMEFNINSPKQLGDVLFDKLGMPHAKKTKTGYSTAASVLEKLAPDYPIVSDILNYRQLTKLKSTYADGLGECIADDGRIHSTFQQTVTATGRLSSTEPNLQNIPIRMELGKKIRKVFFPKKDYCFVDADYSQIELRVLAHLSEDENLIEAYRQNRDIHRATASLVFHTPFDEVTELQRRGAKAVNFGIVYGISSFGLGQDLGISPKEAQQYIDDYYLAYPKLKTYLDGCIKSAKDKGYSVTLFGRRRPLPEISSGNFMQRSFGERVAMNAPIQGTAADIIKIAMIRVYKRLLDEKMKSRLILQVHDELLIEAAMDEVHKVNIILDEEMKQACELAVSLEIDVHEGLNWYDAK